jgi:hypothetical protein
MRAWTLAAMLCGCGGQLGESRVQGPASPRDGGDLRAELLEKQQWFDRATSVEASATDCAEVCRVGEEICTLADRICGIAEEHPRDDDARALCEEARERCERARRHVAASRCGCRY